MTKLDNVTNFKVAVRFHAARKAIRLIVVIATAHIAISVEDRNRISVVSPALKHQLHLVKEKIRPVVRRTVRFQITLSAGCISEIPQDGSAQ